MSWSLAEQFRSLVPTFIRIYVPATLLLGVAVMASLSMGVPIERFTRDPAALTDSNPFLGVISNIGILLWCASAAVCVFSYLIVRESGQDREVRLFFLLFGLLTLLLMIDDLFLFHEEVFLKNLHLDERITYVGYIAIMVSIVYRMRVTILNTDYILLLASFVFFSCSIMIDLISDLIPDTVIPWQYLFEDGMKFVGIVSWFGYFLRTGLVVIQAMAPLKKA